MFLNIYVYILYMDLVFYLVTEQKYTLYKYQMSTIARMNNV